MPRPSQVAYRLPDDRHLSWKGAYNARDLGGLPAADGRVTRWGAIVRSDSLERLEAQGWEEVEAYGVRTVIDLRNASEIRGDLTARPASIETVNIPLDVAEDREFWDVWESGPQFATPLYYRPHLDRFPERSAEVIRALARARPGGVVFHCQGGRDRAGQIAMLVLALAGVEAEAIAADYVLSDERLRPLYLSRGEEDEGPKIAAFLQNEGTTATKLIVELLATFDVEAALRGAGLREDDVDSLRRRLLPDARHPSLGDRVDPAIRIVDHDPAWAEMAAVEIGRIEAALGEVAVRVEHVGSTAVPGLAAKPIVDLQVAVATLEPAAPYVRPLEELGYLFAPDPESPDLHFFGRPAARPRTHHVHVCEAGGEQELRHLALRDYLRAHPEEAARYAELKRALATRHPGDRLAYVAGKAEYVAALERRAVMFVGGGGLR